MVLINRYNHSLQWCITPSNYSIVHLQYGDRRPTAARTGARPMLNCQSPHKPDRGLGLPASAARNDLTQPHTSSRYGLRLRALPWGYLPVKCLTPVNITHILLWYNSSLRVVSSTLRLVRIMNNTIFPYDKQHVCRGLLHKQFAYTQVSGKYCHMADCAWQKLRTRNHWANFAMWQILLHKAHGRIYVVAKC